LQKSERIKLKAGLISTLITLLLAFLKFMGHLYTGSDALLADSLHSFTDSLSSVFVSIGIFLSTRKSKKFPYGLYKVENLVSLVVAVLVIFAGGEIIIRSFKGGAHLVNEKVGLLITAFSIAASLLLGLYKIRVSKKTNSPSLRADGYHSMSDALSSVVVFLGIFLYSIFPDAERVAGVIVAGILMYAGFEILKQSLLVLLDVQLREEDIQKIMEVLNRYKSIKINFIRGRSSGSHYFIDLGISMPERSLKRAHEITEDIERKIKNVLSGVEDVIIHYEPLRKEATIYAIPIVRERPTTHIGRCESFLIFEYLRDKRRCYTVKNPGYMADSGRGALAVKTLLNEDVDVLLLPSPSEEGMVTIIKEFFKVEIDKSLIEKIISECKVLK